MGGFSAVNDDILQNILFRLPASSFASAACVRKSWNRVCNRVMAYPKIASAMSLNPSFPDAVREVLDKVLSGPIRPQFAIASIGTQFSLEAAHQLVLSLCYNLYLFSAMIDPLISRKLGSKVPVVTSNACGIIGRDAITNTMKEVRWRNMPEEDGPISQESDKFNRGIVLIVGYLPGLMVDAIPLLRLKTDPQFSLIDRFLKEIKNYTAHVSGLIEPAGIIMFGDQNVDMTPVLAEIDCVMSEETVIVGDASSRFICNSGHNSHHYDSDLYFFDAVALVFAKDKNKPQGIGETRFHSTLSAGLVPFGPELRAISVASKGTECSWMTVSMNGFPQLIDSQRLLDDINRELNDESAELYIGVIQKRPSSIEQEKMEMRKYLAFYDVLGGDDEYLVIEGVGVQPGDTFLFYHADSSTARSSCLNAFEKFKVLRPASSSRNPWSRANAGAAQVVGGGKGGVFGGLMFSSHYRGEAYYDSFPIYGNFPGVPIAGLVCSKEIGRDSATSSVWQEAKEESPARCSLHVCTSVYLVLSYIPPPPNLDIN
ncbi:hypothetical protein V6N11_080229 [Hibiscus sabdariffa]|uniref:Uncharacterized protein n=1 Tax=Hibiscus sabdariffa TaxID=183260 RepID=A0ABR2R7N3_9ROSI